MYSLLSRFYKFSYHFANEGMQHLIDKTGLGVAVTHVIRDLDLECEKEAIRSMLIEVFSTKFIEFKKRHSQKFPSGDLIAYYAVQNEYPIGKNDVHQYFRCLAYDVKIGKSALSIGQQESRKNFTIIEGYSRNERQSRNTMPKAYKSESKKDVMRQGFEGSISKEIKPSKREAEEGECEKYMKKLQKTDWKKLKGL